MSFIQCVARNASMPLYSRLCANMAQQAWAFSSLKLSVHDQRTADLRSLEPDFRSFGASYECRLIARDLLHSLLDSGPTPSVASDALLLAESAFLRLGLSVCRPQPARAAPLPGHGGTLLSQASDCIVANVGKAPLPIDLYELSPLDGRAGIPAVRFARRMVLESGATFFVEARRTLIDIDPQAGTVVARLHSKARLRYCWVIDRGRLQVVGFARADHEIRERPEVGAPHMVFETAALLGGHQVRMLCRNAAQRHPDARIRLLARQAANHSTGGRHPLWDKAGSDASAVVRAAGETSGAGFTSLGGGAASSET